MDNQLKEDIRQTVRETYGKIAEGNRIGCGPSTSSCCGPNGTATPKTQSERLGYSAEDVKSVPEGADMGLGCGNPQAIAALKPGETVLDLGSGGGFDCFLAARQVGPEGHVIGVDMTPAMVSKARGNIPRTGLGNVEFRLGEIEHLPVADQSVDVIISNCVINLSPEKRAVFQDAYRVLRPGGRIAVADIVATAELPEDVRRDLAMVAGCVAGAEVIGNIETMLAEIGFTDISVRPGKDIRDIAEAWMPGSRAADYVVSANIEAVKPAA